MPESIALWVKGRGTARQGISASRLLNHYFFRSPACWDHYLLRRLPLDRLAPLDLLR